MRIFKWIRNYFSRVRFEVFEVDRDKLLQFANNWVSENPGREIITHHVESIGRDADNTFHNVLLTFWHK